MTWYRVYAPIGQKDESLIIDFPAQSLAYAVSFCQHIMEFRESTSYLLQKRVLRFFYRNVKRFVSS